MHHSSFHLIRGHWLQTAQHMPEPAPEPEPALEPQPAPSRQHTDPLKLSQDILAYVRDKVCEGGQQPCEQLGGFCLKAVPAHRLPARQCSAESLCAWMQGQSEHLRASAAFPGGQLKGDLAFQPLGASSSRLSALGIAGAGAAAQQHSQLRPAL